MLNNLAKDTQLDFFFKTLGEMSFPSTNILMDFMDGSRIPDASGFLPKIKKKFLSVTKLLFSWFLIDLFNSKIK